MTEMEKHFHEKNAVARETSRRYRERNRDHYRAYMSDYMARRRLRDQIASAEQAGEIVEGGYRPYDEIIMRGRVR